MGAPGAERSRAISPPLTDKIALRTSDSTNEEIAEAIAEAVVDPRASPSSDTSSTPSTTPVPRQIDAMGIRYSRPDVPSPTILYRQ